MATKLNLTAGLAAIGQTKVDVGGASHLSPPGSRFDRALGLIDQAGGAGDGEVPILLTDLIDNPYNPREFYYEDKIQARAASLARDGQLNAILVCPALDGSGKYITVDGGYRKRGAAFLKWTELKAKIRHDLDTPFKIYLAARASNVEREGQDCWDDAFSWKGLIERGDCANEVVLAEMLDQSLPVVNKILKLAELPRSSAESLSQAKIGYRIGYECYLLWSDDGLGRNESELKKFVDKIIKDELSLRKVEALRKSMQGDRTRYARASTEVAHEFALSLPGGDMKANGRLVTFPDGRLQLEIKDLPENLRASVFERIKQLLASPVTDEGESGIADGSSRTTGGFIGQP